MVKIRLAQTGKKNDHYFRIVAVESASKRDGKNIAILGYWHPRKNGLKIDKKALNSWVEKGAVVTSSVKALL